MDTLATVLVPSSALFLQQSTQRILKATPAISSKGLKCINRALVCHGVDKSSVVEVIAQQCPVWAAGAVNGSGASSVGVATQNVLAMLSSRDVVTRETKDGLLGNGCLSDPFILSGLYDALLRTPVLKPTSQEFAFAVTPKEAALVYDQLFQSADEVKGKYGKKKAKAPKGGKKTGKLLNQCGIVFAGPQGMSCGDVDATLMSETTTRLKPLLDSSLKQANATEFGCVVAESKGGMTLDFPLACQVSDLRDRLWQSMLKRGESMVGMYIGARGSRAAVVERASERNRRHFLGPKTESAAGDEVASSDDSPTGVQETSVKFDLEDPDVLPYVWRMMCSCQRTDQIDALLRRFPMVGNYLFHPPVNTNCIGGMGNGVTTAQPLSVKYYARLFPMIEGATHKEYIVNRMDRAYIESVLLASIEDNSRETVREWAFEGLIMLDRLCPLSPDCVGRLVTSFSKRPLVSLGFLSAPELFKYLEAMLVNPRLAVLLPHFESPLCDSLWNVVRNGNASVPMFGLHEFLRSLHNFPAQRDELHVIKERLGKIFFSDFASRLAQDPVSERTMGCQAAFLGFAGLLGHAEGAQIASATLASILASQQAQYESLAAHINSTREELLTGHSRDVLRALSVTAKVPVVADYSRISRLPDDAFAADASVIRGYKMRPRSTPNTVVGCLIEACGAMGKTLIDVSATAIPVQHKILPDQTPPTFAAHVLGPRSSSDSADELAAQYIKYYGSARMLTTELLYPHLGQAHGWHAVARDTVLDHFNARSKQSSSHALPSPDKMGYTVPLCRAMLNQYALSKSFREDLQASGLSVSKELAFSGNLSCHLPVGAENPLIPIVLGTSKNRLAGGLIDCSTALCRSVSATDEVF